MKLENLLSQKGLVLSSPTANEIRQRAMETYNRETKIFYGETYDNTGNTIDSMKYYFFVANLAQSLNEEYFKTNPTILIADTAACRNVGPELQNKYLMLGESRANFVGKINKIYNTRLNIVKMSDYIDSGEFQSEREEIMKICWGDNKLMKDIEKTVPESKIDVERKKGFMYSFDEITTIMGLDVKVGPPREDLYDNIARQIAERRKGKQLMSLFLTPTFPIGMGWEYFFVNEGIENHGITAYKGGSKRLQKNRIFVPSSDIRKIKEQIKNSFISTNSELPNPVLDIGIICEMARMRLGTHNLPITLVGDFYEGKITPDQLKRRVGNNLKKYILSRFEND